MKTSKIIAVDFDGTLFEDNFPHIGRPVIETIDYIKELQRQGHRIVLNTCRNGKALQEAVKACLEQGLVFTAINDQDPIEKALWNGETSTKVFAHYYLDDHNVGSIKELQDKLNKEEALNEKRKK